MKSCYKLQQNNSITASFDTVKGAKGYTGSFFSSRRGFEGPCGVSEASSYLAHDLFGQHESIRWNVANKPMLYKFRALDAKFC